ncbi:hypothetical protein BKA62DRAFT_701417 [Auriculariales sp. MPI-PUGE-AT-0066]|nr:hypothetical protein BKA62DRAFT_701417 [Auriculariales sp. MPI-PUGE-AT-0066]
MAENPFEPLRQIARAAGGSLKRLKLHSSQPWITSVEQSLPQILEHLPALAHFTLVIPSNAMTRCYERQLCLSVIMRDTSLCPMLIELELQWYDMEGSNRVKSTSDGSSLPSIMSHRVRPAASTPSFAKRRVPPLRSNSTSASWEPFSAPPTVDPPESSDGLQPPSPTSLLPHPSAYNMEMSFIREAVLSDEDLRSQGSVTNSSLRSSRLLSASVFNSNSENTDSTTTLLGLNEILESAKAHRPFMRVSIHEIERRIEWWREWDNHERW